VARHRWISVRLLIPAVLPIAAVVGCGRSDGTVSPRVPPDLADRAYEHLAAGQYEEAAAEFERFVQAHPDDLEARRRWAYALASLDRFDDADRALRTVPTSAAPTGAPGDDPAAAMLLWRRAFNVYRYYYHVTSPNPRGVFRAGVIRDALAAIDIGDLPVCDLRGAKAMSLGEVWELLRLWLGWDLVARDADLCPDRQWIPVLVVSEGERLKRSLDQLVVLEQRTTGAVWLHPEDRHGYWLAHPGVVGAQTQRMSDPVSAGAVADELTETAKPSDDLLEAWTTVLEWLDKNVPSASVSVVAAIRRGRDAPFDRRILLIGRLQGMRLNVERIGVTGPAEALMDGYAEFRRLRRAKTVSARTGMEVESLARAYPAAGLPATDFTVDETLNLFAQDHTQLAWLLSYVRYGRTLFENADDAPGSPGRP
jgi:hypothetical protein